MLKFLPLLKSPPLLKSLPLLKTLPLLEPLALLKPRGRVRLPQMSRARMPVIPPHRRSATFKRKGWVLRRLRPRRLYSRKQTRAVMILMPMTPTMAR